MSIRDRIEDSKLLFDAGKLEGALISILIAVAGTSRKRYPAKAMKDREAFVKFLVDERSKLSGGQEVNISFRGVPITLENLLYKLVRSSLVHEAALDEHISFEYGDFLVDKRGTTEYFTFSSELALRLSYVVVSAPENKNVFSEAIYDRLPEPIDLKRMCIVKYQYGDQHFEMYCSACSIQEEVWIDTGELITWLHACCLQSFGGIVPNTNSLRLLIPTKYIVSIKPGPEFLRTRKRTGEIGFFLPDKPAPKDALSLSEIVKSISNLQIELVETVVALRRPHYEIAI